MTIIYTSDFIQEYRYQVTKAQYDLFYKLKDIERYSVLPPQLINKYKDVMEKMALLKRLLCEYDELLADFEKTIAQIEHINII